jgi:hypothetical protein
MFESRGVEAFMTTVGQLNFFRWFLEKGIYDYMMENREAIEKDMNVTLKNHYSRTNSSITESVSSAEASGGTNSTETVDTVNTIETQSPKSRKKRCELTQSAMKKVNVHECEVVVSFN